MRGGRDPPPPRGPPGSARGRQPGEGPGGGAAGEATVGGGGRLTRFLSGLDSRFGFTYLCFRELFIYLGTNLTRAPVQAASPAKEGPSSQVPVASFESPNCYYK